MPECYHCEVDLPAGAPHPPWKCLSNLVGKLHMERMRSEAYRATIERASEQLLEGMVGLEEDLPQAFVKLSKGHAAAVKTLLAMIAVTAMLVGCGGSAFSVGGDGDDGGAQGDTGTHVVGTDAGAGESEAAAQVDATPETTTADAAPEAAPPVCLSTLSGVGTGDFHISFTLTTTAGSIDMALVNQRTGCDNTSTWWDVSYIPSTSTHGALGAGTSDGTQASYVVLEQAAGATVDDGNPHQIVVARTSGQLWFSIDGTRSAGPVADPYSFGPMPQLKVGTDDCAGFGPTIGSIENLCITTP